MAFMTWTDNLSVGVESLDKQHKVLVESLNNLHAAMMKGQARAITGELLHTLVNYTREHFAAEEVKMQSTNYPASSAHRVKHRELTKQVEEFVKRYESGDIALTVQLLNFLSDWLTTHIQGDDQKYGPWLNQRGVV